MTTLITEHPVMPRHARTSPNLTSMRAVEENVATSLRAQPIVEDLAMDIQRGEAQSLENGMPQTAIPLLIIDDDIGIRHFLRRFFEDTYPIYEATDGREGLRIMRAFSERMIVLLDRMMPYLDGIGVLRAVAEDPDLAYRHSYLLVTARTDPPPPEVDLIMAQLHVPIILKPVNLDALQMTVRHVADRMR
jgi:CheY-like chemotaxis protein